MVSAGINRTTGTAIEGFEHVKQSIGVILNTPVGSRVMRRDFGSELFDLIDRPMTDQVILAVYSAVAMALARWEPRFRVMWCRSIQAGVSGVLELEIGGIYYPRGHLGDFTLSDDDRRFGFRLHRS